MIEKNRCPGLGSALESNKKRSDAVSASLKESAWTEGGQIDRGFSPCKQIGDEHTGRTTQGQSQVLMTER